MSKGSGYCMRLYSCEADNHHHIITGLDQISWPFWSRDIGLEMVDYWLEKFLTPDQFDESNRRRIKREAEEVRAEILRLSRIRNFDRNGRFKRGFKMSRWPLTCEEDIAIHWGNFRRGQVPYAQLIDRNLQGSYICPLFCDFVGRETGKVQLSFGLGEHVHPLAQVPVLPVSMVELGIHLEVAA